MPNNSETEMIDSILNKYDFNEVWREVNPSYTETKIRVKSLNGLEATGKTKLHKKDTDMRTERTGVYIASSRAVLQIVNNSINTSKLPINITKEEYDFIVTGKLSRALKTDLTLYINEKENFYKRIRLQREGKTGVKIKKVDMDTFKKAQSKIQG